MFRNSSQTPILVAEPEFNISVLPGDFAASLIAYEEGVENSRIVADALGTPDARYALAGSLAGVGALLGELGDSGRALSVFGEALEHFRVVAKKMDDPDLRKELASDLHSFGALLEARGQMRAALVFYEECSVLRTRVGETTGMPAPYPELDDAICRVRSALR